MSIGDVVKTWPRPPCCDALLFQLTKGGELVCWKCGKKYSLTQL